MREAGVEVRTVEDLTGSPEILDGRVKTLHPDLHAGLLAMRDDPDHQAVLEERGIEPIDLVCVNLYPFERTVARLDVPEDEAIENIDIGGPTMIRAAAKNHRHVAVVVQAGELRRRAGRDGGERWRDLRETRHWLANEAFALTARYDAAISRWFASRYEALPHPPGLLLREAARPLLRREPAPAGCALRRVRRALAHPLPCLEAARQGALLQQRARPRLGAEAPRATSTAPPA